MNTSPSPTSTSSPSLSPSFSSSKHARPRFDHEKLDVYQLELCFLEWVALLLEEVKNASRPRIGEVCDQLDRASLSALLNTAEACGKRQMRVRAKFFDDARGSTTECAACLDAMVAKKICSEPRIQEGKEMLLRIVAMLTKLVERFSTPENFREECVEYGAEPFFSLSRKRTRTSAGTRTRTRTEKNPISQ